MNQMDPDVNPCEDFHKFVCGNAWKNTFGTYSNIHTLKDKINVQVRDLCKEPIRESQHIILKTAKKLFEKCMIDTPNKDYLKSVLNALEDAVGGWPLLQDSQWDETKFDWLKATYKLRELGFPHSMFLNLSVAADPRNEGDYVFKISLPEMVEYRQEVVWKVAALLKANREKMYSEMEEIKIFVSKMNNDYSQTEELRAIDDYYKYGNINWRQFINTIVGPVIQIPTNDVAIFPKPQELTTRLQMLASTSKRTLANYMIWKVVEEMANIKDPIFLLKLRSEYSYSYRVTSPEEDCLNTLNRRFPANPLAIMYARNYIPFARSEMANELATNIKEEFLKLLHQADWMDKVDQENAIERVNTMDIMVGAPKEYYDDQILDEMNADLEETSEDSLLSLFLQVNKNYQTRIYQKINSAVHKSNFGKLNQPILGFPHYSYANNVMSIPLGYLQGFVFSDTRQNYLNYGSLGAIIGTQFVYLFGKSTTGFATTGFLNTNDENLWTDKTKKGFATQRTCLATQAKENIKSDNIADVDYLVLRQGLGEKLSYAAYKKWSMDKSPEPMLVGIDYTPDQLFWISSGHMLCQKNQEQDGKFGSWQNKAYSHFVSSLAMNNWNFAKDFNCSVGSNMNPVHKCNIF